MVSRLHGHSSASGANLNTDEEDCVKGYEARLERDGVMTRDEMNRVRAGYVEELAVAARRVIEEPQPTPESIWDHVFAEKKGQS
jgi:2-oxoisovalerate dehydrogenase E1 component alpha subunit